MVSMTLAECAEKTGTRYSFRYTAESRQGFGLPRVNANANPLIKKPSKAN
jgi:hypothetical protein